MRGWRKPRRRSPREIPAWEDCDSSATPLPLGPLGEFFRFLRGQLLRPWYPSAVIRARSGRFILREPGRLLVGCVAPVVPAFRADVRPQPAADVNHASVGTPRTAQKNAIRLRAGQPAMAEHVAGIGRVR